MKKIGIKSFIFLTAIVLFSNCTQNTCTKNQNRIPLKTGNEYLDIFLGDGDSLITRPQHLGIVNGMASVGIAHHYVGVVEGFWATPYVSSDFYLEPRLFGERIKTDHYTWLPFQTQRIGQVQDIVVTSKTTLIYGMRAGILNLKLKNTGAREKSIPLQLIANNPFTYDASLDFVLRWEFSAPVSRTPVKTKVDQSGVQRVQGDMSVAIGSDMKGLRWEEPTRRFHGEAVLAPGQELTVNVAFSIGQTETALKERATILSNPNQHIEKATNAYISKVENLFDHLPRFYSDNKMLEQFYNRSLSIFITNKAEVPENVLNPHYGTGSVKGGCTCNYLWDFGEVREILHLVDPEAAKAHVIQFLRTDCIDKFYAFYPMTGEPFGAWYAINHEKITGYVYNYVKLTGDTDFLNIEIKDGKTVLDLMMDCALFGNDVNLPVSLIDYAIYGSVNSHLELRRTHLGYEYSHVMPDLNGRRHHTFYKVSELYKLAGKPQPFLMERAEQLKVLLKKELWSPELQWFHFINSKGEKDTRWTIQMYKLFEGNVLDEETKQGLLSHLNEAEFLSAYGFHSMSKKDPGYDQVDIDNGGGGGCPAFPVLISEFLYKDGKATAADDIMSRILWWGQRMPYIGDSQVANEIDYRQDTPLQASIQTGCLAQCIIFGMMGVEVSFDGTITIDPKTSLSKKMELKGLKLRGKTMDVTVDGDLFKVTVDGKTHTSAIGTPVII